MNIKTLKELRESKNKTQEEVAREFGITKEYLSMLETGKRNPSDKLKKKMSVFYKVSIAYIFLVVNQTKCLKSNKN